MADVVNGYADTIDVENPLPDQKPDPLEDGTAEEMREMIVDVIVRFPIDGLVNDGCVPYNRLDCFIVLLYLFYRSVIEESQYLLDLLVGRDDGGKAFLGGVLGI